MQSRQKFEALFLAGMVAITRFGFRSHFLYDLDSVNFALGIKHFDPRVYQPHPPGYFLYVCLGWLVNAGLHNANLALVVLSIAASCGVIVLIYRMALDWFGLNAARFAAILFLVSPLAWFHGTVALTYSVEAFFSALLGYLCWRVYKGSWAWIVPAGLVLGVSAGIRQSSLLFLAPLFLFSLRYATARKRWMGLIALMLALIAWFLPMIWASGGVDAYFGALFSLMRLVPAKHTVFNSSPATSIARACTIVFIYCLAFGTASLAPLGARYRTDTIDASKKLFTIAWIAPSLLFFTFIFLLFVNSGYLLILSAPACIWLGFWASEWYQNAALRQPLKLIIIGVCAIANVLIFLLSPLYCSYRSVRRFEDELENIRTTLPQIANAQDTLIIAFDSHFLGYRHAGYYLPGYFTVEYPEVKLKEGTRIFVMHDRTTRLLARLPATSCSRFILFPLPLGGSAYVKYVQGVEERFQGGTLRTIHAGRRDYVTGPISALPNLFPVATSQPVSVPHHSAALPVNERIHRPK
ncbi:MAG: hypothetical protein ABI076_05050 [Acidobacteriaceae bacterium]